MYLRMYVCMYMYMDIHTYNAAYTYVQVNSKLTRVCVNLEYIQPDEISHEIIAIQVNDHTLQCTGLALEQDLYYYTLSVNV